MANFDFNTYQANQQVKNANGANQSQVKFFKLADGAEALVRIYCETTNDLQFATVHKPNYLKKWEGITSVYTGISCLNEYGQHTDNCPFCTAANAGHPVIGKSSSVVYVKMIVAYINADGSISEPQAMIWERPAAYSRDIATKIKEYGNLKEIILKLSRNGSGKETRYSLDYALPARYPDTLLPKDFSAFDTLKVDRFAYQVKTLDELNYYVANGIFAQATNDKAQSTQAQPPKYQQPMQAQQQPMMSQPSVGQTYEKAPWEDATPTSAPAPQPNAMPYNKFSF